MTELVVEIDAEALKKQLKLLISARRRTSLCRDSVRARYLGKCAREHTAKM